jgi:hypothetical protein
MRRLLVRSLRYFGAAALVAAASLAIGCSKAEKGGPVVVKANFDEYNGSYDGTRAVFLKLDSGESRVVVARDCPSFACDSVDVFGYGKPSLKTGCPKSAWLVVELAGDKKAKVGESKAILSLSSAAGGNTAMTAGQPTAKVTVKTLDADTVTGSLEFNGTGTSAVGPFSAKVCPTPH